MPLMIRSEEKLRSQEISLGSHKDFQFMGEHHHLSQSNKSTNEFKRDSGVVLENNQIPNGLIISNIMP